MNALGLLGEIIAAGGKPAASAYRDRPGYAALLRYGFLQEVGVASSVVCDDCSMPHSAQIVFEGGRYGYYCPDLGYVSLDQANIQALRPGIGQLVGALAEALGCKRRRQTPVHGQTWRIGMLEAEPGGVMLYVHPKLQSEVDAQELSDALSREVRAQWRLIVTSAGTIPVAGAQAVRLDDFAELNAETGALRIHASPADLLGMQRKTSGGRPNEFSLLLSEISAERDRYGVALSGRNEEAKAILAAFKQSYPDKRPPSLSTVRDHVSKCRAGQ